MAISMYHEVKCMIVGKLQSPIIANLGANLQLLSKFYRQVYAYGIKVPSLEGF